MEMVPDLPVGIATALAATLLHSLWQCALLAVAAAATLQILNRQSAALRHAVGMGFLVAMSALPAWTFLRHWWRSAIDVNNGVLPAAPSAGVLESMSGWAWVLCALWLFGVALMLVRHLGGLWWLGRLEHRDSQALPAQWQERLDALRRTIGITRRIVVRVAEAAVVPFTARLFRPIIWMPQALLSRLPREQIEALLAHELAHIHRLDWLWNSIQCAIEALLFFHPGVWWLSQRIREERELACDDCAVTACADSIVLAEALAALARDRQPVPRLLLAADGSSLMKRVTRLVAGGAAAPARPWLSLGLIGLVAIGAVVAAPFNTGYAAPSARAETSASSVSNAADLQGLVMAAHPASGARRDAEQTTRTAEEGSGDVEQATRDAEQRTRAAEQVMHDREQRTREAEEVMHDAEQRTRDAEQVARDDEQAARLRHT
ncbi:MAG: M56 family metallopeptidase [Terricaulis sp.]